MSVFFRVAKVEVVGNSIYTAEEVVEASGIGTGDNLFFINRFSAASRIFSKLPYVDKAKVTRALPNRVTITIQESSAMAYVQADDGYWVVDQNCKLLKSVTESELTGLARVDGITPVEPKVGEVLNARRGRRAEGHVSGGDPRPAAHARHGVQGHGHRPVGCVQPRLYL